MIAIIDYGVGNLFSLMSSLEYLGLESCVTSSKDVIEKADRIILPGVGAFGDAIKKLEDTGLIPFLREQAKKKPFLGICLGMQLLFETSNEYGDYKGIGLIEGDIVSLEPDISDKNLKVPHMGWNRLDIKKDDDIFKYTSDGEYVYYVHSYYGVNCQKSTLATSEYGVSVTGVVKNGFVYGMQFHPEKSGDTGLRLLKAFSEI